MSLCSSQSARKLLKRAAETNVMSVPCSASTGHQNIIHQVAPALRPLFPFQELLLAARGQMQLPKVVLIERLHLSRLSTTLVLSS